MLVCVRFLNPWACLSTSYRSRTIVPFNTVTDSASKLTPSLLLLAFCMSVPAWMTRWSPLAFLCLVWDELFDPSFTHVRFVRHIVIRGIMSPIDLSQMVVLAHRRGTQGDLTPPVWVQLRVGSVLADCLTACRCLKSCHSFPRLRVETTRGASACFPADFVAT